MFFGLLINFSKFVSKTIKQNKIKLNLNPFLRYQNIKFIYKMFFYKTIFFDSVKIFNKNF